MRTISFNQWLSVLALSALCATSASAQPAPQGAGSAPPQPNEKKPQFWGLFGGGSKDQPHSLDLNASASGVYDDNLASQLPNNPAGQGFGLDPRGLKRGYGQSASGALSYGYRKSGRHNSFTASANTSVQEFAGQFGDTLWFYNYGANAGFRHDLTPKITASLVAASSYAPFYRYAPFLQDTVSDTSPAGQDYGFATEAEMVRINSATATIEDRFTRRSSVSFGATWERQDVPNNTEFGFERRIVQGRYSHNIFKKLAVHAGYGVEQLRAVASDVDPVFNQSIDLGLGYGDGLTLKLGRYYTLTLGIGVSVTRNGDPRSVATTGKSTAFGVNGSAILSRSIGRAWGANIGYRQGTQYMVGFTEPIYLENAFAGIGGPVLNRLYFSAGAGASRGELVFSESGTITSYNASARLNYALWSNLALFSQASYYRYSIPSDFTAFAFTPQLDRRSVSVGLSTWIPLIKRPRPPRPTEASGQP